MCFHEVAHQGVQRLILEEQGLGKGAEIPLETIGEPDNHDRIDAVRFERRIDRDVTRQPIPDSAAMSRQSNPAAAAAAGTARWMGAGGFGGTGPTDARTENPRMRTQMTPWSSARSISSFLTAPPPGDSRTCAHMTAVGRSVACRAAPGRTAAPSAAAPQQSQAGLEGCIQHARMQGEIALRRARRIREAGVSPGPRRRR